MSKIQNKAKHSSCAHFDFVRILKFRPKNFKLPNDYIDRIFLSSSTLLFSHIDPSDNIFLLLLFWTNCFFMYSTFEYICYWVGFFILGYRTCQSNSVSTSSLLCSLQTNIGSTINNLAFPVYISLTFNEVKFLIGIQRVATNSSTPDSDLLAL